MRPLRKRRAVPSYEAIGDLGTLYTSFYSDHTNLTEQLTDLEGKFHLYQNYYDETTSSFEQMLDSQTVTSDLSMDTARTLGVRHKWEVLNFFSRDDVNGDPEIFQYVDDDGSFKSFSPEEVQLIKEWRAIESYPVKGIEGHHVELISDNRTNIPLAAEPDNILFATSKAHFHVLHEGSYFNRTNEQYVNAGLTKEEMLESTLDYNYKLQMDGVSGRYEENMLNSARAGLLSGAVLGTLTGVIQFINIQRLRSKGILVSLDQIKQAQVSVAITALKPVTAMMTKSFFLTVNSSNNPAISDVVSYKEAAKLSGMSEVTEQFTEMLEIISIPSTIIGISSINLFHTTIKQRMKKERSYLSEYYYKEQMKVHTYEMMAFTSMGIGFDYLFKTEILEAFKDSFVEEGATNFLLPSASVAAVMTAYRVGKFGKKQLDRKKERKASEECKEIHFNNLYGKALLASRGPC